MKCKRPEPPNDVETVASATECTGLMTALPADEASDAASAAMYGVHPEEDAPKR